MFAWDGMGWYGTFTKYMSIHSISFITQRHSIPFHIILHLWIVPWEASLFENGSRLDHFHRKILLKLLTRLVLVVRTIYSKAVVSHVMYYSHVQKSCTVMCHCLFWKELYKKGNFPFGGHLSFDRYHSSTLTIAWYCIQCNRVR